MSVLSFMKRYPARASEWVARMRGAEFDEKSDQKWREWMAVDPMNPIEMENTELAFELTEELRHRPAIEQLLADVDRRMVNGGHRFGARVTRPRLIVIAAVAAALVAAVAGYVVLTHVTVAEYATDVGEQNVVTLADNSTVSLNTGTRIRVEYSRRLRRVELLQGEAAFSVEHNAARPFVVGALRGTTTAVGTEFVVQVRPASADVSVIQGTVAVQSLESDSPERKLATLSVGQSVQYAMDGSVTAVHAADVARLKAWQAHRIVFNDVSLQDAVQEYNRYTKTPIVVGDTALGERHINGVFKIGDKSGFLGALEKGLHVKVSESDTEIRIDPQ